MFGILNSPYTDQEESTFHAWQTTLGELHPQKREICGIQSQEDWVWVMTFVQLK